MNGVLGMGRLLLETNLTPEQRTYTNAITESGEALLALIGDILDFSKIESGMLTLEEDEVDIRQMIGTVSELLATRAHAKSIELISTVAGNVPGKIRADQMRLRQIVINLVGNAVKFTEAGGVSLTVCQVMGQERHFVRFEVRDTGVGVAPEKRKAIFEEFVQADSSHARKFGGTGLGLAISRRLVETMGGEIGVDEAPGGGSMFWFTVPAIVVEAAPPNHALQGVRVAVVSPNRVLAQGLTQQIREAGGDVLGATTSPGDRVDALLIDGGVGQEPLPVIEPQPGVPTFLLVAPAARSKLDGLEARGFAGYLLKPVRQTALIERLLAARHEDGREDIMPSLEEAIAQAEAESEAETETGTEFAFEPPPFVAAPPPPASYEAPPAAAYEPAPPTPEAPASPSEPAAPAAAPESQTGLTILLAEDNPINMMLIRELLRRRGHHVVEVTNGTDAVKAMAERRFDLLLTDIHMPGMDGIEAARAIRKAEEAAGTPRVPIVALTADALETGKRACQDAGMDGFLTKPVDPAELEEMFLMLFPSDDDLIVAA
jgi:CheY-like chemotaxis protein